MNAPGPAPNPPLKTTQAGQPHCDQSTFTLFPAPQKLHPKESQEEIISKMLGRIGDFGADPRIPHPESHRDSRLKKPDIELDTNATVGFLTVAQTEWYNLFKLKLAVASTVMDVAVTPLETVTYKSQILKELLQFISECHRLPFEFEPWHEPIIEMFRANIFRDSGPLINPLGAIYDPEEDEPILDSNWPHLQLVFEIFVRFLESPKFNTTSCRRLINQSFLVELMRLFDSEDPRQRDYAKTVLHRIYGKFLQLRPLIRRLIQNFFIECIEEDDLNCRANLKNLTIKHNCSELLEILGSIVNGFAVPLREEHSNFLLKTLLPMHKCRSLILFHPQLTYCLVQFVEKDPSLVGPLLRGLFRYWPKTHSTKQVLFLNELEQVLDICEPAQFSKLAVQIAQKLAAGIGSSHFQVAERSLSLIAGNEYIAQLVMSNSREMLPLLFPPINSYSRMHWNKGVQMMAIAVLRMFMETSPQLFDEEMQKSILDSDSLSLSASSGDSTSLPRKKSTLPMHFSTSL
jgi:serine/threonine-protein phosphatase 2A regulatory subunit B'